MTQEVLATTVVIEMEVHLKSYKPTFGGLCHLLSIHYTLSSLSSSIYLETVPSTPPTCPLGFRVFRPEPPRQQLASFARTWFCRSSGQVLD